MGHAKELITVDVYGDKAQLITDNTEALDQFISEIFSRDCMEQYLLEIQDGDSEIDIDCEIERMFA